MVNIRQLDTKNINRQLIAEIKSLILVVLLIAGTYEFIIHVSSIKNAIALATTVKPETFTELYFEDHSSLPKIVTRHQEYSFVFTVHNVENKEVEYPYEVYIQRDDQKIILDQGDLTLKDNEYKSINENFGPLKNLNLKIVVELINKNQNISFWMTKQ
jgi:hypothetical protein